MGNVLVTVTDRRLLVNGVLEADVVTATDYYPFGMSMPNRNFLAPNSESYRYGFNGKERDKDIASGNYDFGARIYDVRIGRFFTKDPLYKKFVFQSSYCYALNNPIRFIDAFGLGPVDPIKPNEPSLGYYHQWKVNSEGKQYGWEDGLWVNPTDSRDAANTLLHVTDDNGVQFWIVKYQFYTIAELSNGQNLTVLETDYYYFDKPPSSDASTYKGGKWYRFETLNEGQLEANNQIADGLGLGMGGIMAAIGGGFAVEGVVATVGTKTSLVWVTKEVAEETFTAVTEIPVILDPIDLVKGGYRFALGKFLRREFKEKFGEEATKSFGSYTIKYADGTVYHGAGNVEEALTGAMRKSTDNDGKFTEISSVDWTLSPSRPQQFRDEAARLNAQKNGHKNPYNRNDRDSPGNHKYKDPKNDK